MAAVPTIAVLGLGSIGRRHAGNLIALGCNVRGYDVDVARCRAASDDLGIATTEQLGQALGGGPDAVVIASPTSEHVKLAAAAAGRGLHLFVEKPLSHDLNGVAELVREVERRELVSLVGCNLRWHPGLRALKRLLDEGRFGKVLAIRVEAGQYLPDWHPSEDYRFSYSARRELGGGVILDFIHELDYARWLLGRVETVACLAGRVGSLDIDTEDIASISLRFEVGAIGQVHIDYLQRAYSRSCEVIAEEGTLKWNYEAASLDAFHVEDRTWRQIPVSSGWEANQMYVEEMQHFLGCLAGRERSAQDVASAAEVLRVALACKSSAQSRTFVDPADVAP